MFVQFARKNAIKFRKGGLRLGKRRDNYNVNNNNNNNKNNMSNYRNYNNFNNNNFRKN